MFTHNPKLHNTKYKQPPRSKLRGILSIKNFGIPITGSLKGLKGAIVFDPDAPEKGKVNLSVDATTIDTGIGIRNTHLKKKEYLDVNTHPFISFESNKIEKDGNRWIAQGKISMKEITKDIVIPFEVIGNKDELQFKGEFNLNRNDFEIGGNSLSMADELTVTFLIATNPQ